MGGEERKTGKEKRGSKGQKSKGDRTRKSRDKADKSKGKEPRQLASRNRRSDKDASGKRKSENIKDAKEAKGLTAAVEDNILLTRGYVGGRMMGEGGYSKVRKALRKSDGSTVAIKVINRAKASNRFLTTFLPRELSIAKSVKHPNLVTFIDHFTVGHQTCVVMELAPKGDLEQFISLRGKLVDKEPNDVVHKLFKEVFAAIQYLHGRMICHRDLKCENIFLGASMEAKVGDFGFARTMEETEMSSTFCGSKAYAAPELLCQTPYKGLPADMWSMGVVFYIALTARMPFDDRDLPKMTKRQKAKNYHVDSGCFNDTAKEFLQSLLDPEPDARPTATQALDHAWFTGPST